VLTLGAVPGTPAAQAGLETRPFVLTEVDGEELDGTMPGYCDATSGRTTGDEVDVTVVPATRGGRPKRISLEFG
jgi:C-terminal processing protease CtpA/Prc